MKIDKTGHPAARAIHTRGMRQKAHHVGSPKAQGVVQLESLLEVTFLGLCELDPRVVEVVPQPLTFDLNTGRTYRAKQDLLDQFAGTGVIPRPYTPDFRVSLICGRDVLVETKAEYFIQQDPKFAGYPEMIADFGYELHLLSEIDLTTEMQLNVKLLRQHVGKSYDLGLRDALKRLPYEDLTFRRAIQRLGCTQGDLLRALLLGHISTNMWEKVTLDSRFVAGSTCQIHLQVLPF